MTLLRWVDADAGVDAVEASLNQVSLTLGPAAVWGRGQSVRDWVLSRLAVRLNPALGRIEDIAGAFGYEHHGSVYRTVSTPREACGPELRSVLYDRPAALREIELRLLPLGDARWLKLQAKDIDTLHASIKHIIHRGVFCAALWTELATGYLCFTGRMAQTYAAVASELGGDLGMSVIDSSAPRALELLKPAAPEVKTWPMLAARDALMLGDPWAVIVASK